MNIRSQVPQEGETEWSKIRLPLDLTTKIVHIIRVRLDLKYEEWSSLAELLTDDERTRAERFRFDEPRQRFITCCATLRQLLADCCGVSPTAVPLQYGNHGKPRLALDELDLKTPRIEFSVSHSGDIGLIAITLGVQVGIDIEEFNPGVKALKLAERFFADVEAYQLRNLPTELQLAGFYRGWTCKEAYIKATGRGLSMALDSFAVTIDPREPAALRWVDQKPNEPSLWTTTSIEVAHNYAAAVMAAKSNLQTTYWDWPAN